MERMKGGGDYGLLSAGDNRGTGAKGNILGSGGLIKDSAILTIGNLPTGFQLLDISNVSFQYGSALSDPNYPGVHSPEPASLLLLGTGLAGLCLFAKRKNLF